MAIAFPIPRIRLPCYPPRIREQDDDVIVVKISAIRIRWISMSPFDRVLLQSYVRKICILFFLTRKIQGWIVKRTKYQEIVYPTLKWLNLGETRLMKSGEERERRLTLKRRDMYSDAIFILATFLLYPSRLEFILSTCFTEKLFIQPCAYGSESYKPSKLRFHKNP